VAGAGTPLGDRTDMVYMNTGVTRGSGEFVVTATGMATEVGRISGLLAEQQAVKTPLTRQMDRLSKQVLVIGGVALVAAMSLNLARGDTFIATFNAAAAIAIAAIPVALPLVVTTILAYGTEMLAKAGAIMKRLPSAETLGSTSAINSDKTGTLTLGQMTAVQMVAAGRRYAVDGNGYSTAGRITRVAGEAYTGLDDVLMPMVLASDAVVRDGELGRGLYDNLARYIRYQVSGLFGYIITFLSASVLNIAGGEPLLPLQTLGIFQTVMGTRLDVPQWLTCTAVALSIVAAAEIRKAVRRRTPAARSS
jgi:magnesium-transporting ATPase (P-type)